MGTGEDGRSTESEAQKEFERVEQQLAQADEELKHLDEEILEAKRKSKEVIVPPEE
jgi:hypothetical protein